MRLAHAYGSVARVLCVVGGVILAAGAWLWLTAPSARPPRGDSRRGSLAIQQSCGWVVALAVAVGGCNALLDNNLHDIAQDGAAMDAGANSADATLPANAGARPSAACTASSSDGTPCGTDGGAVCRAGACVACSGGADCSEAGSCVRMTIDCSSGNPICTNAGPVQDGFSCGVMPPLYCSGGVCSVCTVDAPCAPGNPCHLGKVSSCAGGVAICSDLGTTVAPGKACSATGVASGVCDASGVCVACSPFATCQPAPCQSGIVSCASGPQCTSATPVEEGQPCGSAAGQICHQGACAACNATSCPDGCCSPSGCLGPTAQTSLACGGGGAACGACSAGTTCQGGRCGGGPQLSLSPAQFAFPTTALGTTSASHAFVVSNLGSAASATLATAVSGTNASDFAVVSDGCNRTALAAGSSCTITLQFTPGAIGQRSASLSVNSLTSALVSGTGEDFVALDIVKGGAGGGTVKDASGLITCGSTCLAQVPRTTSNPVVALTATPDASSVFSGWSGGGCSGTGPCQVTLSGATTVTAQFDPAAVALKVSFHGLGSQAASIASSPAGVSCSGVTCTSTASFPTGTTVTLSLTQAAGALVAWSNGCSGATCKVSLAATTQTVTVTTTNQNIAFVNDVEPSFSGSLGGLAGADTSCAAAAAQGGLPGHYVAFLGTTTVSQYSRLGSARGWIRPDGLPFTDTVSGFQSGVMWYPLAIDEVGLPGNGGIWTGSDGTTTCADWTTATGDGLAGIAMDEGLYFANAFEIPCSSGEGFACFGTDLAAPVAVTPASGRHAFASTGSFTAGGGLAAADALCQMEASAASLPNPTHFLAALSTTTTTAASRFNLNGAPWVRVDGVLLASTPANLMAGTLVAPPYTDHNGAPFTNRIWVGSAGGLTSLSGSASESCGDWTSTAPTATGIFTETLTGTANASTAFSTTPYPCTMPTIPSVLCLEN